MADQNNPFRPHDHSGDAAGKDLNPNSVNTPEISIDGRPQTSQQTRDLYASTFDTLQAMYEEIPVELRHRWNVYHDVDRPTEDVEIPGFITTTESGFLMVEGDRATPSNVSINTINAPFAGGKRPLSIRGLQFEGTAAYLDGDGSLQFEGPSVATVVDCNFANSNGTARRAITVYGGGLITKGDVDLGTDVYEVGIVAKNHAAFTSECSTSGGTLSGSCTSYAYWSQNSTLFAINSQDTLSGGVNVNRSPIYEFDSSDWGAGLILRGPMSIDGVLSVDEFENIDANSNPIYNVMRQRFNFGAQPSAGDGQAWLLVDDGTGPYGEGDLYMVVQDTSGTEKTIQITDFSAGSSA